LTSPPSAAASRAVDRARETLATVGGRERRRSSSSADADADADAAAAARLLLHPPTTARGSPPRAPHDVVALVVASRSPSSRLHGARGARHRGGGRARAPRRRSDDAGSPPPRDALARPRAHPVISLARPLASAGLAAIPRDDDGSARGRETRADGLALVAVGYASDDAEQSRRSRAGEILGRTAVCPKLRVQGLTPVQR